MAGLGARIKQARAMAGLSLRALGDRAGVSAQAISKYERDIDTPGSDVLLSIANSTGVRIEYFFRAPISITSMEFRKRSGLSAKREKEILALARDQLERYLEAESLLSGASNSASPVEDYSHLVKSLNDVETVAERLRKDWKLGLNPIESMSLLLEDHGIKVVFIGADTNFDALAVCAGNSRAIVMKKDLPGDRQRFNLAHELGHLAIPQPRLKITDKSAAKVKEAVANRFAGAFIVPQESARKELGNHRKRLDLLELHLLKHKYGMSMSAWIYRAKDLNIISDALALQWFKLFSREGWRKKEPGDELPSEQEPTKLVRMVLKLYREGVISELRASELLGQPMSKFWKQVKRKHGRLPVGLDHGY